MIFHCETVANITDHYFSCFFFSFCHLYYLVKIIGYVKSNEVLNLLCFDSFLTMNTNPFSINNLEPKSLSNFESIFVIKSTKFLCTFPHFIWCLNFFFSNPFHKIWDRYFFLQLISPFVYMQLNSTETAPSTAY